MIAIREINCKNILVKSKISDFDYSLNPYTGCEHKCQYCYAVFMRRFTNHTEKWGEFVDVKINAKDVLLKQIRKINDSKITIGTVCDPYQPVEQEYKITRECLEILSQTDNSISVLTKSKLILRDIDVLRKIKNIEVGFSISIYDTNYQRIFEPNASTTVERFDVLKILKNEGIKTFVFVAPILPFFSDNEKNLENIFFYSLSYRVDYIFFDKLNLYPSVFRNLIRIYKKFFPDKLNIFFNYHDDHKRYCRELKSKIIFISKNYKINVVFCF